MYIIEETCKLFPYVTTSLYLNRYDYFAILIAQTLYIIGKLTKKILESAKIEMKMNTFQAYMLALKS